MANKEPGYVIFLPTLAIGKIGFRKVKVAVLVEVIEYMDQRTVPSSLEKIKREKMN